MTLHALEPSSFVHCSMLGMLIPLFNSFYVVSQVVQQQEKIIDILSLLTQQSQTESSQQHQPPSSRSPSLDSQQRPATVLNRQEYHDVIVLDQPESQIRKQPYTASRSGVRPVSRSLPFHKDPGLQGLLSSSRSFPLSGQETINMFRNKVSFSNLGQISRFLLISYYLVIIRILFNTVANYL